ncbi:MAG: hypothetical protein IPG89_11160 [Bacteroidetes bacterium]|nr:hypothetical protein [Bacteroidota bacterium]
MEKKKIIIPNLSLKENDFSNAMKKISSSIKEQKEISTKIEGQYITNLKYEINSILQSKLTNKEK